MATDTQKMIELVKSRTGVGIPENAIADSVMQDPDGNVVLKVGFMRRRDVITEIGFEADPRVPIDIVACLAAMTQIAKGKRTMEAYLISVKDIMAEVSDNGELDPENVEAAEIADIMLKEALRKYSMVYKDLVQKVNEYQEAAGIDEKIPAGLEAEEYLKLKAEEQNKDAE